MVFHWSLNDSKSRQVSWTLLSILDDLNNPVGWMVSIRPPTSNPSSPFQAFGNRFKRTNDNWYNSSSQVRQLSRFSGKV